MIPKTYVVERSALAAWREPSSFALTFEETSQFIHNLQNAMFDQRQLSIRTGFDFFILVLPKKEGQ